MTKEKEEMYAGLGHLFYSIAASDGRVEAEEASKLKALVKRHWIPGEHGQDEAGSDLAYYIEIGFDHANDTGLDARAAFNRFKETFFATKELYQLVIEDRPKCVGIQDVVESADGHYLLGCEVQDLFVNELTKEIQA